MATAVTFRLVPAENERLAQVCGQLDAHLQQIERRLRVKITQRDNAFKVTGALPHAHRAETVIRGLFEMAKHRAEPLSDTDVHLQLVRVGANSASAATKTVSRTVRAKNLPSSPNSLNLPNSSNSPDSPENLGEEVVLKIRRHEIRGHNSRQRDYLRRIQHNDINFAIGPAGTGKTYLAVACAVHALTEERVERILLVRPAVEAGEKLGFLPGDIGDKIDPYLRPLFDALYEMLGFERVGKLIARGVIELAPLAYMRGRTLNEAFVILDEAQNTTADQMKMFLTRIGFSSKAIVTGDITQVDLPREQRSGLKHAHQVLRGIEGISFTRFFPEDVVRHPLVQQIVEAYEKFAGEAGAKASAQGKSAQGKSDSRNQ